MGEVSGKRQRTGEGEIVPREYASRIGRREFFGVLHELVPESFEALYAPDFADSFGLAIDPATNEFVGKDQRQLVAAIRSWLKRWRLDEPWVFNAVLMTVTCSTCIPAGEMQLERSWLYAGRVASWFADIGSGSLAEGQIVRILIDGEGGKAVILPYELTVGQLGLAGGEPIIGYDPRTESVDQATARALNELKGPVRRALEAIKEHDHGKGDNVPARALPSRQHFEWTVRYQVMGETYSEIARADCTMWKTVSTNIHSVADLIELTLRDPDRGGAPAGKAQRRKPHTIAIRHTENLSHSSGRTQ